MHKHKEMGCICFENPAMGIYFINRSGWILAGDRAGEEELRAEFV